MPITRRRFVGMLAAAGRSPLIDTHIHLFEPDRFPYHANAAYRPPASPLEPYLKFVEQAKIDHTIIVHPEPYQEDHRYLEYCFEQERPKGLFKGTLLLDPLDSQTPARMQELVKRNAKRIVAMRVHAMNKPGEPWETSGTIKNRDLGSTEMKRTWAKAADLGIAIQMHFLPHHAPAIAKLCQQVPRVDVILDHMGRVGQGSPADVDPLLGLSRHPRVYFKFSGVGYSSRQPFPHSDAKPVVQRAFHEFGAGRMLWGGLGHSMKEFERAKELFAAMFDFATEGDRDKIRGGNAARLFLF